MEAKAGKRCREKEAVVSASSGGGMQAADIECERGRGRSERENMYDK